MDCIQSWKKTSPDVDHGEYQNKWLKQKYDIWPSKQCQIKWSSCPKILGQISVLPQDLMIPKFYSCWIFFAPWSTYGKCLRSKAPRSSEGGRIFSPCRCRCIHFCIFKTLWITIFTIQTQKKQVESIIQQELQKVQSLSLSFWWWVPIIFVKIYLVKIARCLTAILNKPLLKGSVLV